MYKALPEKLNRIPLNTPNVARIKELSQFIQIRPINIRKWYLNNKLKSFPKPLKTKPEIWNIFEIENFLKIELKKVKNEVIFLEPLLSIQDIMIITNRVWITVYNWIKDNKLKAIKITNRVIRIEKENFDLFIDGHSRKLDIKEYYNKDRIRRIQIYRNIP
jgi:hypothetical protein